jgi:hypothetical protein
MRKARRERGQILPIVAVALVGLLGIAAFSIDVGYAYFAKRQLQAATDASALAGAQDLPAGSTAISTAISYASANSPSNLPAFTFTYDLKCTTTAIIATGCTSTVNPNELLVTGSGSTDTWFAGIFGIKHFNLTAHANACSPCSSTPVDIVIALDRTGSMCDTKDSGNFCRDLDNAKDGIQTMLKILNPPYAQIGMVAFPPVEKTTTGACSAPYTNGNGWTGYDASGRGYVTDTLNGDYKLNGSLNLASSLVLHTTDGKADACVQAGGSTSYSEALRQSQAELLAHGRPKVPDYIVFLTDGEANLGSVYGVKSSTYPPGNADDQQPCNTAINLATTYKAAGTTIYSIGYALGNKKCTSGDWPYIKAGTVNGKFVPAHYCDPATENNCDHTQGSDPEVSADGTTITSNDTLSQIASPGDFKNQPSAGDLNSIFAAIATDIGQGSSRLVDDSF